jgi:hypothetical protein
MIRFNRRRSFLRRLLVTALPLVLLEAGTMRAYSACVSVTGANGTTYLESGGAATATSTTDPSSCAIATGGNGGSGILIYGTNPTPGQIGGAATSTATTSIGSGAASAEATSFGGHGGAGAARGTGIHFRSSRGGDGGAASSSATASSGTGSASVTASSTASSNGGVDTEIGYPPGGGGGGTASSSAAASSTTGSVSATASSAGGANGTAYNGGALGSATVSANARNSDGAALTTASAPDGSAMTNATVGSGSESLVAIAPGQAVSNAILTPNGPDIGVGAMSAAYGGGGEALEYSATAVFDFTTTRKETIYLNLQSYQLSGIGFGSLDFSVTGDGPSQTYSLSSLTGAESFFEAHALDLGLLVSGSQSIQLEYSLSYASGYGYSANAGGFGFTYDIADPPLTGSVPEPSTWAMMALGFAALAFAGYRRSRKGAAFAA